ncbi:PadR family transcriptional regulator [Propionicimonas paludicola]|uniref:PadR family transcriptional regulator n=1 Tax=Propionicimonas paludicola TaxID=185243 RepID=A0A2A9CTW2_9ACTN|nr:helix-turn-helix transcriptional regulator [Propionicimonas paludicola]PFG17546.1 PadR family transcriptional regulator [Propionicimonas paludicola]
MEIDKQLLKGTIPLLVLHLLAQADLYGYQLIKALEQISSGAFRFSEGSLYPVLHTLDRDGMLHAYWRQAESGRQRKYYAITDRGRRELVERRSQWRNLTVAIDAVLAEELPHD